MGLTFRGGAQQPVEMSRFGVVSTAVPALDRLSRTPSLRPTWTTTANRSAIVELYDAGGVVFARAWGTGFVSTA